jgi:hypothetical protein
MRVLVEGSLIVLGQMTLGVMEMVLEAHGVIIMGDGAIMIVL